MTARSLTPKLIGTDPRTDLAVLKVEEEREFTYVAFADDNRRVSATGSLPSATRSVLAAR
jgi:S1-C subfamily serine protease